MSLPKPREMNYRCLCLIRESGISTDDLVEAVKKEMNISDEDAASLTKKQTKTSLKSKVEGVRTALKNAGLIDIRDNSIYFITDKGKKYRDTHKDLPRKELERLKKEMLEVVSDANVKSDNDNYKLEVLLNNGNSRNITTENAHFMSDVYISDDDCKMIKSLLKRKKNIILQGAPGVGKTFFAKKLCYSLAGDNAKDGQVTMIQFHQNYSYEDFVMGYKPKDNGFELAKGVFYNLCKSAEVDENNDYYLIIDEINRGNLSKIFGELLMLIEKDYRGDNHKIKLAYSDELFSVPDNLYIIGMMNTADRSLAMIDYALRRRFSFFDMKPAFENDKFIAYKEKLNWPQFNKVIDAVKNLNKRIANDESLGEGFMIGHSYFCNAEKKEGWLSGVVKYDIEPMLCEYWFDDLNKARDECKRLEDALK